MLRAPNRVDVGECASESECTPQGNPQQMTIDDWHLAVHHEMRADMWHQADERGIGAALPSSPTVEAMTASSNGNGNRPKVSVAAGYIAPIVAVNVPSGSEKYEPRTPK
jgi:hypothetical protein